MSSAIWRLRAYAFCHGLAFHALTHAVHVKSALLNGSYEMLALLGALQVVALLSTEALSSTLSRNLGCWHVLRLCGMMRVLALGCLIMVELTHSVVPFGVSGALLCLWSLGEGVSRALYSGSDVELLYHLSSSPSDARHNLSVQHGMWPLAMVIACLASSSMQVSMSVQITASWCAAAVGCCMVWGIVEENFADSSRHGSIPWRLCGAKHVWQENRRALEQIWSCLHTHEAWVVSLLFTLLSETLNKLRPFLLPSHSIAISTCASFSGSFFGSMISEWIGSRWPKMPLVCYALVPWAWWIAVAWQWNALIYVSCLLVSVAFGVHKCRFQAHLFANSGAIRLTKTELLSSMNLSNQVAHALWMCMLISPLLDWHPTLLPWLLCANSSVLVIALFVR